MGSLRIAVRTGHAALLAVGVFTVMPAVAVGAHPAGSTAVDVATADVPTDTVGAGRRGPIVRVGVAIDRGRVELSSPGGLRLRHGPSGRVVGEVPPGGILRLSAEGTVLRFDGDLSTVPDAVGSIHAIPASSDDAIHIDGRPYRGSAEVRVVVDARVSAINELPLEDYLLGVVPLEIGPRDAEELAAVEAQAVAARTYAVAQLGGQWDSGFDLFGTVEDQAYGGIAAERDESTAAVRRTAGRILLFEGRPIRAYYHSTCGGRTAAIEEVMDREPAPYLQSVLDSAPDGSDYCEASPRYRWNVLWSPAELDAVSRAGLAAAFSVAERDLDEVESLEIVKRTPSGRVEELAFLGPGMNLILSRLEIRRALPQEDRILYSTDFSITRRSDGLVELSGRGYGHGAGMCQWGAIGRARAGQDYEEILTTYYPGAILVNAYEGEDG